MSGKTPNPSLHPTRYSGLRRFRVRVNSNVGPPDVIIMYRYMRSVPGATT